MNRFSFFPSGDGRAVHDVGEGIQFSLSELERYTGGFSKENFVGYGRFGSVYRGTVKGRMERDLKGKKIAVKVSRNKDEAMRKQWEAETQYLPLMAHKNIINLIGTCETADRFYLVYPYMEKRDVKHHLKDLDWSKTLRIIKETTYAIEALHAHTPALIYRDLKPDNLLLDKNFTLKLADFGGVTVEGESFQHGSAGYTDPIILNGGPGTKASTIYSLGVVILQLIMKKDKVTIAGTDSTHISDWAAFAKGINGHAMDPVLKSKGRVGTAARTEITDLGLACVSPNPWDRPTIDAVLHTLKNLS